MERVDRIILKLANYIYRRLSTRGNSQYIMPEDIGLSADQSADIIFEALTSNRPCMIARYGSTELMAVRNAISVCEGADIMGFITGRKSQWWWMPKVFEQLEQWSGFFPATSDSVIKFKDLVIDDTSELDVLAVWTGGEKYMPLNGNCKMVHLLMLEPYWSSRPWTRALKGKRVLVVHPFAKLIEHQYERRLNLFEDHNVLPEFELCTIEAVQTLGGSSNKFKDWFEALDWMKSEIDKIDYDICLLGCGAYGFSLAAHVKRQGKKAIHMGGALQLLFGIKGKRWENPNYARDWHMKPEDYYLKLLSNPNWIRPDSFKSSNFSSVENGCYW